MREDFELLLKLQLIDERLKEIDASKGTLPFEIKRLQQGIEEKQERRTTIHTEDASGKEEVEQLESQNEEYSSRIKELQNDLFNFVSSNKEYETVTQNIDSVKEKTSENETRILELLSRREANATELAEISDTINEFETDLNHKTSLLDRQLNSSQGKMENLHGLRENTVAQLKKPLYDHYERIRNMRDGRGVVLLTRGACGGCFQTVPPQQQAEIRSMQDLVICEICGRIIVSDRLELELKLDE